VNGEATRDRILDAAEKLFALCGIGETSLRGITTEAGTNLASVNYHFGSKEALIQTVFARRLGPLNLERLELLDKVESDADGPGPFLEQVLCAFVTPALRLRRQEGGENFMRLFGRLHTEPGELSVGVMKQFDDIFRRFTNAIGHALPGLSGTALLWRFFFTIGALTMPLVCPEVIRQKSDGLCDPADAKGISSHLVTFLAAGLRAQESVHSLDVEAKT
jgi:AcrR family transcriptional regulator